MRNCKKCGIPFEGKKCKVCAKAYAKSYYPKWYAANPEKVKEKTIKFDNENPDYAAIYYAQNTEKIKSLSNNWRMNNPDKVKAYGTKQYANNKEKMKQAARKWCLTNPEKVKACQKKYATTHPEERRILKQNRLARKRNAGGRLTKDLSKKLFNLQKGKCACCGKPLGTDYHLDHRMPIALSGANEDWNMQLLRATCNMQKSAKHPIDFMQSRGFLL